MQILSDVPHSKTGANSSQVSAMAWNVPGEMFSRFLGTAGTCISCEHAMGWH